MIISENFAQKTVDEMKEIINRDINFMNHNGIIIASTTSNRIGTYHEGAKIVAEKGQELIVRYDNQYLGSKRGVNLPVYFERKIIGVIGISGDYNEVEKYGKIIKRMTEILVKEAYLKNLDIREIENQRALVEDLLFNDKYLKSPKLIDQINVFKIVTTGPKLVIISRELYDPNTGDDIRDRIFNIYYNIIKQTPNNLIMQSRDFNIMIVEYKDRKDIETLIKSIISKIQTISNIKSKFGIGATVEDIKDLKSSYLKSKIALDVTNRREDYQIIFYEDMDIEMILNPIPDELGMEFADKIFNKLTPKEIEEFEILFRDYELNNGSINNIATGQFLHKNAIQYRLNKYAKKIGYDMRIYKDFTIIKIATTLRQLKH